MADLTDNQRNMLNAAAANKLSVVERPYMPGFEGVTWDRNAHKLCERGYLKPYVHGGFEITDAGRKVIAPCLHGYSRHDPRDEDGKIVCKRCGAEIEHNCPAKGCPVGVNTPDGEQR